MLFTDEFFKFPFLLFTPCATILNTHSLAALVTITQNIYLARSLRTGNSNPLSDQYWRVSRHPCKISTSEHWIFCSCQFHMHSVKIQMLAPIISYCAHPAPHPHSSGSCTLPANAGTQPARVTHSAQDS